MLNMTIEEFKKQLDELIDIKLALKEKQKAIGCDAFMTDSVIISDTEKLIEFARLKKESIQIKIFDQKEDDCSHVRYAMDYRESELVAYSSEEDYESFKKAGFVS